MEGQKSKAPFFFRDPEAQISSLSLNDEDYGKVSGAMVGVTPDAVIVNRERRSFFFAYRRDLPVIGWWWMGGREWRNESDGEALRRNLKRELGIEIAPERFEFETQIQWTFKLRKQLPQEVGVHVHANTYFVELTPEEIGRIQLRSEEYEVKRGLKEFGRAEIEALTRERGYPYDRVLQFYDDSMGSGKSGVGC